MELYTIMVSDHVTDTISPHAHNYYQFIYCQSGVGTISVDEREYAAIPGRGYLVKPMVLHAIEPHGEMRLTEIKFYVSEEKLNDSIMLLPEEVEIDEHLSLRMSLKEVVKEGFSKALYCDETTNAALLLFLIRLLRKQKIRGSDTVSHSTYFDPPFNRNSDVDGAVEIAKVIEYIDEHLSEQLTLEGLAEVAHFEKSYLTYLFNKLWGVSPMRYVNHLRVERAKLLLAGTEKSVTEIAAEVGFKSIHYFSRFFKEKENISPNDYRVEVSKKENKND